MALSFETTADAAQVLAGSRAGSDGRRKRRSDRTALPPEILMAPSTGYRDTRSRRQDTRLRP